MSARPPFVAAIDFGGTKAAIATATAAGDIVERARVDIEAPRGAAQAVSRTVAAMGTLISATERITGGRCAAAGVVSPGIVRDDRVDLAPNVPGWDQLALASLVRDGLGIECVSVGNDAKAAGLAEARWGALRGADPALYLSLGTGVSAAVLVGGQVVPGAHGAAGEIGYSLRGVKDETGFADGHAPLEELAGGRFIGLRASALTGRRLTAAEAFAAADPATRELVDRTLDELGRHVANLSLLLDPERIAVGGGLMGSAERVLAALSRCLYRAVPFPPPLVTAMFPDEAALRGAVALALDAVGDPLATSS